MTDIPIIFSAAMIQALLAGRKTMTRRLAWRSETDTKYMDFICDGEKPNPLSHLARNVGMQMAGAYWLSPSFWQYVKSGDRLWVRESLQKFNNSKGTPSAQYVADISPVAAHRDHAKLIDGRALWNWSKDRLPSIYMPRWASRLTLIVTATKIEHLQEISEEDAIAEGVSCIKCKGRGYYLPSFSANFFVPCSACLDEAKRLGITILPWQQATPINYNIFRDLWVALHDAESWLANPEVVCLSFKVFLQNIDAMEKAA